MSNEQKAIERTKNFIEDYKKLLTQPRISNSTRERAEKDITALKVILKMAEGENL